MAGQAKLAWPRFAVEDVHISNALKQRIPYRAWRKLHYLTLPARLLASLHGMLAGTDAGDPWFAAFARLSRVPVRA